MFAIEDDSIGAKHGASSGASCTNKPTVIQLIGAFAV